MTELIGAKSGLEGLNSAFLKVDHGLQYVNVILHTKCLNDKAILRCMNLIRFVLYRLEISLLVYIRTNLCYSCILLEFYCSKLYTVTFIEVSRNLNWTTIYIIMHLVLCVCLWFSSKWYIVTVTRILNSEDRSRDDITNATCKMSIEKNRTFFLYK